MTQWSEWLAAEAAAGRGGAQVPAYVRGEDVVITVNFSSDQSASTFTGSVAISPDAAANIADFTVSEGAWNGTNMAITFTLPGATTLPADSDADGLSEVVFSIEQDARRIIGGVMPISGAV